MRKTWIKKNGSVHRVSYIGNGNETKPFIRLQGEWLNDCGFEIKSNFTVFCDQNSVLLVRDGDEMRTISLNFEANDLPIYGFDPAEETEYGCRFRNGNTDIYYDSESDSYLINKEGHILFNGRISSHGFCKQLLKSIEAIK